MASSSEKMQEKSEKASSSKEKSENAQLQEDIAQSLLNVIQKRSEAPPKLKGLEEKILNHKTSLAEDVTILPSTDTKKVVSKYPLKQPLPEEFKISKEMPNQPEELVTRVDQLIKNQLGMKKPMCQELIRKKK